MKTITVSTEVFAEIWKKHKPGDQGEDDILRRIFGLPEDSGGDDMDIPRHIAGAHHVERFGVTFPEGFEIFRVYKGREYRATVRAGRWVLRPGGKVYPSLNKLSWAVVSGHENAWQNWNVRLRSFRPFSARAG